MTPAPPRPEDATPDAEVGRDASAERPGLLASVRRVRERQGERFPWRTRLRERRLLRLRRLPSWMRVCHGLMPSVERMRGSRIGRLLGSWLLRPECWSFKPGPAALGTALGLFITWTPTIGIQMALVVVACCLLRANIPLAVLVTWVSNVVTAVPIFGANLFVGLLVMGRPYPWGALDHDDAGEFLRIIFSDFLVPLWVGSVIVGAVVGLVGYFATYGFIYWQRQVHLVETLRERAVARLRKRQARRVVREKRRALLRQRRQRLIEAARMRMKARRPLAAPGDSANA